MHANDRSNHAARHGSTSALLLGAIAALMLMLAMITAAANPSRAAARPLQQRTIYSPMHGGDIRVGVMSKIGPVLATWYGPGFWGHRTGCGRALRRSSWGVAHRTLPCGRMVLLKFRGRQVAVPVIDRGPYSGATLDLTERTAEFLHFKQVGGGDVGMTVIDRRIARRSL